MSLPMPRAGIGDPAGFDWVLALTQRKPETIWGCEGLEVG